MYLKSFKFKLKNPRGKRMCLLRTEQNLKIVRVIKFYVTHITQIASMFLDFKKDCSQYMVAAMISINLYLIKIVFLSSVFNYAHYAPCLDFLQNLL